MAGRVGFLMNVQFAWSNAMLVQLRSNPDYLVTDAGDIISIKSGKWRKITPFVNKKGYVMVSLYNQGKAQTKRVHRLVMEAFYGPSDLEVNHKNGIKSDNRLENLEYCTQLENIEHAFKAGLRHSMKNETNPNVRFSNETVNKLLLLKGTTTAKKAGQLFGISKSHVIKIWNGIHRSQS